MFDRNLALEEHIKRKGNSVSVSSATGTSKVRFLHIENNVRIKILALLLFAFFKKKSTPAICTDGATIPLVGVPWHVYSAGRFVFS